jgi:hypothetical protein
VAYFVRLSTSIEPLEFWRDLIPLLTSGLEHQGKIYSEHRDASRDVTGWSTAKEVIVVLGSASVFSTFYQILKAYLSRNKNRELIVETEKGKIAVKGHTLPEEKELLGVLGLGEIDRVKPTTRPRTS